MEHLYCGRCHLPRDGLRFGRVVRFRVCAGEDCGRVAPVPWYVPDRPYDLDRRDWRCPACRKEAREAAARGGTAMAADAFDTWLASYTRADDDGPAGLGVELYEHRRDAWNGAIRRAANEARLRMPYDLADDIDLLESGPR